MGGSIFKHESSVDHRVASLRSLLAGLMESLADSSDKLRGNAGAGYLIYELVGSFVAVRVHGLNVADDSSILSGSSRLFFVKVVKCLSLGDGLSVVDTGLPCLAIDSELPLDPLNVDLQMELAHPADDHLL